MKWFIVIPLAVVALRYMYHAIPTLVYVRKAQQGDAEAQFQLALRYWFGYGVKRNSSQFALWMLKAAEQGYAKAQYEIGVNYAHGYEVEQDLVKAAEWLGKAAAQGNTKAQYELDGKDRWVHG